MNPVIPLLTAFIAAFAVLAGALVTRSATRYSANLQALQRKRDAELDVLGEFAEALLDAATAVQSYTFHVDHDLRLRSTITEEQFEESLPWHEAALVKVQRLRFVISALPWPNVVRAAMSAHDLLGEVITHSEDRDVDPWAQALRNQPDAITTAIATTAAKRKELLDSYPVVVPKRGAR